MELFVLFMYALIGLIGGFAAGLFGIGGGAIKVPLLAMTGMPLINAFAVNMFAIPFSSATGAFFQRKNIDYKAAKPFIIGAVLAIALATFFVGIVSSSVLAVLFFLAAVITVIGLYIEQLNGRFYKILKPTTKNLFLGGFITNIIIGLRGGSGGSLFAPVLKALHLEMHHAVATSLFVSIFSAITALLIYLFRGDILFIPAIIVGLGSTIGSFLGSHLSLKTTDKWLKLGLALVVFLLALNVLFREFM